MSGSRIGITGHSRLTDLTHELVAAALRGLLADARPLVGVTCLAQGSDQLLADVVLELGGDLEVILPSNDYARRRSTPLTGPTSTACSAARARSVCWTCRVPTGPRTAPPTRR